MGELRVAVTIVETDDANCDGLTFVSPDTVVVLILSTFDEKLRCLSKFSKFNNRPIEKSYPDYQSSFP